MLIRHAAIVLALSAPATLALAQTDPLRPVGAEQGYEQVQRVQSTVPRADVRQEALDFRRMPVTADGYTFTDGELGYTKTPMAHSAVQRPAMDRSTAVMGAARGGYPYTTLPYSTAP